MRILVAPDKLKGTLTAGEAARVIAEGWRRARPNDRLDLFPMSDGGDGFGELLASRLRAEPHTVATTDAAGRRLRATWWWQPRSRLAILECAQAVGLAQLPPGQYHPFDLDTRGLAPLLAAARARRPRRCILGLGGSATNDAGFGCARALGWRFLDADGRPLEKWTELAALARMVPPRRPWTLERLAIAVDVRNPLLGPRGATRIYGPQKGIRPLDMAAAEGALRRLAQVAGRQALGPGRAAARAGAGAAGGLGFGATVFLGGVLEPGFALYARLGGLNRRLRAADLAITSEGAIDRTTLSMGKGVGELARRCRALGKPCLGLAGAVNLPPGARHPFAYLLALAPTLAPVDEAMARADYWLREAAYHAAWNWQKVR